MGALISTAGPLRIAAPLAAALVLLLAAFAGLLGVAVSSDTCAGDIPASPSGAAERDIPDSYLTAYRAAGSQYGLPWQILAAIGAIETDHGRSTAPGVRSGVNSYGCCAGPMQFNLTDGPPSTWQRYGVDGDRDGTKDAYDHDDAIHSAGNYLHALLRNADGDIRQAIFGYNRSHAYVNDVLARARKYAGEPSVSVDGCASGLDAPAGPADVQTGRRLTAPRAFRTPPTWAMAGGRAAQPVDARIYNDVVWMLRRYHLRVTAAREPGHQTHGDGTAIDLVPADGITQAVWDASAGQLVHDLGWHPGCGSSGTRPSCPLVPAIQFIGYDGYRNHGSPRTCSAGCPAHLHISWTSGCFGSGALSPPCTWVTTFDASQSNPRWRVRQSPMSQPPARHTRSDREAVAASASYRELIKRLRQWIGESQAGASRTPNRELVLLYWSIGRDILAQQQASDWRDDVIGQIAQDCSARPASAPRFWAGTAVQLPPASA